MFSKGTWVLIKDTLVISLRSRKFVVDSFNNSKKYKEYAFDIIKNDSIKCMFYFKKGHLIYRCKLKKGKYAYIDLEKQD